MYVVIKNMVQEASYCICGILYVTVIKRNIYG